MTFFMGSVNLIRCTISPSFEKMQMFYMEGSSSLMARILVLSDVMAIGPPKDATDISM